MCDFLQLENTVIVYPCNVLFDQFKISHPLHYLLFLLESCLVRTDINFLFEHKFKIITWIELPVSNEIQMV
jgi:hypothetical protein